MHAVLHQASIVTDIQLDACSLDDAALHVLQGSLRQCAALTRLDLSDNALTTSGLDVLLATVLAPDSPLAELHLRNNWLGTGGMIKLANAVRVHGGLRHFDTSNEGARPKDFSRVDTSQAALLEMFKALLVSLLLFFPLSFMITYSFFLHVCTSGEYPSSHLEMHLVRFHL